MVQMEFLTDGRRHLVCVPYSITNLHHMAMILKIRPCWFHRDHYDIPKRRVAEIEAKCTRISSRDLLKIIRTRFQGREWTKPQPFPSGPLEALGGGGY